MSSPRRLHFLVGIALLVTPMALVSWIVFSEVRKPADCPAIQHQAAITQRAAELCTTQLVGCSLSYQEVRAVISEIDAAKACK